MKCLLIYKTALGLAALALLVSRIVTDVHNLAVATNHLAVVTDLLDTRPVSYTHLTLPTICSV